MPKKTKGKRGGRGVVHHDAKKYYFGSESGISEHYGCVVPSCRGRAIKSKTNGVFKVTYPHSCVTSSDEKIKDAAMDQIRELVFAGQMRPVDIVHKVMSEMAPESRHLMPSEDSLLRRMRKWAASLREKVDPPPSLEDWAKLAERAEREERDVKYAPTNHQVPTTSATSVSENIDASVVVQTGKINFVPRAISDVFDVDTGELKLSGFVFLKQKFDGRNRLSVNGETFSWKQDLEDAVQLYKCREAKHGCEANVTLYMTRKCYELRGKHVHNFGKKGARGLLTGRCVSNLKLVDDDGNEIRQATMYDLLADKPFDDGQDSNSRPPQAQETAVQPNMIQVENSNAPEDILEDMDNDFADDRCDDFVGDYGGPEENPPAPKTVSETLVPESLKLKLGSSSAFKTLTSSSITTPKPKHGNVKKTGERCCVCGDELIACETLACNESTFRKACCYLNVRSQRDWFPRSGNSQFYSFCDSCSKEIIQINDLYKKVEEIQSLIFHRVEGVEKRVVDAEIVDTWMADASAATAHRFEGFRKQVMINYRNKLKLRREVRIGRKTGHNLSEAQPFTTARMFASDPSEIYAYRKTGENTKVPSNGGDSFVVKRLQTSKRTRGRPKSKEISQEVSKKKTLSKPVSELDDSPDFDDAGSVASEKEVKFWHEDPSRLKVGGGNLAEEEGAGDDGNNDIHLAGGDDEDFLGASGDGCEDNFDDDVHADIGSDSDYQQDEDDDDDEEWTMETSKPKRKKTLKRQKRMPPDASSEVRPSPSSFSHEKSQSSKQVKIPVPVKEKKKSDPEPKPKKPNARKKVTEDFPETVIYRDGRIFMQGIEIIKNPPGHYQRRPYSVSFTCGECGKIILSFWTIRQHICGHHLGLYKCPICFKKYAEPRMVNIHLKAKHHGEEKVTPCPVCGKPYMTENRLLRHRWSHLNEEEKNDPANAIYKQDEGRKKSLEGLQTFMCSYCSKTFYQPASLRKHEKIHTEEAPKEQCQYCGRLFDARNLNKHTFGCRKKALGIMDVRSAYTCPKCPTLRFKTRATRAKHNKRFHRTTTTLPFSCPKCPREFGTKTAFILHKKVCVEGGTIKGGWSHAKKKNMPREESQELKTESSGVGGNQEQQQESGPAAPYLNQSQVDPTVAAVGYSYNLFGYNNPGGSLFPNLHQGM